MHITAVKIAMVVRKTSTGCVAIGCDVVERALLSRHYTVYSGLFSRHEVFEVDLDPRNHVGEWST